MHPGLAVLLLLVGCDGYAPANAELPAPVGAAEAEAMAWQRVGGSGALPSVHYVAGLVEDSWGVTVGGEIWLQLDACPREPGRICRPSQTSLVHEMTHVLLGDPEHRDARWQRVDAIKAELAAAGL